MRVDVQVFDRVVPLVIEDLACLDCGATACRAPVGCGWTCTGCRGVLCASCRGWRPLVAYARRALGYPPSGPPLTVDPGWAEVAA